MQYQSVKAKTKEDFLKGNLKKPTTTDSNARKAVMTTQTPSEGKEVLTGAFAMVEPIQTVVGPVGKFLMQPENFPLHPSVIFYGKRRTGKSFTARDMLAKCFRHIPFGICCSGTAYNGFWQEYIPPGLVYQGLRMDKMQALIERQKRLIKRFEKEHPGKEYKEEPSLAAFVVLGK